MTAKLIPGRDTAAHSVRATAAVEFREKSGGRGALNRQRRSDEKGMARQHCHTDKAGMTYSGGISANAEALLLLEEHRRFRVKKDYGRMVCGYWQENDPNKEPR